MLKAFRYLKPYWISVVAVIVLVFAQVQAQLALPDHMSKIITMVFSMAELQSLSLLRCLRRPTTTYMSLWMKKVKQS